MLRVNTLGGFGARRVYPNVLFAGGTAGAWYDPSDFSTLFQDSAGTIPVTAVEQPVGRMLDKSGLGHHATQTTSGRRPTLRSRYNLLSFSEEFDNWSPSTNTVVTSNTDTAPDGTLTADTITGGATFLPQINQSLSGMTAGTYTFSVWLRRKTGTSFVYLEINTSAGLNSLVGITDSWARYTVTRTHSAGTFNTAIIGGSLGNAFYAWGAQILSAPDQTSTGGVYQRVVNATNYDASNPVWKPYLEFDGSTDSLVTSSINFTNTNKVTAFAGVTKLNNTVGVVAELSSNFNSNVGTFVIVAPDETNGTGYQAGSRGTATATLGHYAFSAATSTPATHVYRATFDISGDRSSISLNGIVSGTDGTSDQGAGNFGNYPLFIGSRDQGGAFFRGRLYSLIIIGRFATPAELISTENWINSKTGAY